MEKMRHQSPDLAASNLEKIATLFPAAVHEILDEARSTPDHPAYKKAVDLDVLRDLLGQPAAPPDERYEFTWVGKRAALRQANTPLRKTLRPVPADSVHWPTTQNLFLEGDNLEVLKLLQESYLGAVKMIYIDPPYNTGGDFVYNDNFHASAAAYDEASAARDAHGNRLQLNTRHNGRFHSDWCSMMYARLYLARNLLRDDGVLLISIDDNEVANLRKLCDELFGEDQFLGLFPRITKRAGKSSDAIAKNHDYILLYAKTGDFTYNPQPHTDENFKHRDEHFAERGCYKLNQTLDYDSLQYSPSLDYPIELDGQTFYPGGDPDAYARRRAGAHDRADWAWRWSRELFDFGLRHGFVVVKQYDGHARLYTKTYQSAKIERDGDGFVIRRIERTKPLSTLELVDNRYSNDNAKKNLAALFERVPFDYPKPLSLIKFWTSFFTSGDDIVLDFFAGSATTAHAVMQCNAEDGARRRFLMVQLPETLGERSQALRERYDTLCEIGKERLRRAGDALRKGLGPDAVVPDVGFRVFRVDSSNAKDVYFAPEEYEQTALGELVSNIKSDRSDDDLLYGCLLEWGLPLTLSHHSETLHGVPVHTVDDDALVACFAPRIGEEVVRAIAARQPARAVFRDASFSGSAARINLEETFRLLAPKTRVKVI